MQTQDSFRFRDWPVYKDTRIIRVKVIKVIKTFPAGEKYALSDQARRALNSILLNLAEGANKNTDKDTRLFVRSIGETTDIVEKEMYTFGDTPGSTITLRPENTAPVMRAYLEYEL